MLHWVELPILSPETCQNWFTEAKKKIKVAEGKICAGYKEGGRDSCQVRLLMTDLVMYIVRITNTAGDE